MKKLNEEAVNEIVYLLDEVNDVVKLMEEFKIHIDSDCWSATVPVNHEYENILSWNKNDFEALDVSDVKSFSIGGNIITGSQHRYKDKTIIAPKELAEIQGEIFKEFLISIVKSISLKHFQLQITDPYGLIDNCGWEHYICIDTIIKPSAITEDYKPTKEVIEEIRKEYECYTYTAFNDNYDDIKIVDNLIGYDDKYACMIEVFSELVEPNKENQAFFGVSDEYIDSVVKVRDDMREIATNIEHNYRDKGVKVTLSKWNQGCEFGMAMYIWIPFQ